jgi:WD40 repeat protein
MRKTTLVLIFICVFVVSGCGMTASPTQPTVESPATVFPTLTSSPLPTATELPATPTLTPEPGLRTNGPYFGYFRHVPGWSDPQFVLMDADGGGRKIIDLPDEITDTSPISVRYVSPDGKWMAFYTGYAGRENEKMLSPGTYDLTLNLLDLTTGEKQIITPLLSRDYPNNFVEAVKEINDSYIRPEDLQLAFLAITQAIAWSPDGKYLAFAGQMDGLSSDLYLYDMTTKNIQRLSNDNGELQSILWSPDGKWILHESGFSIDLMAEDNISVVAVDNSSVRDLGNAWRSSWLNSHEILEYHFGIERYQLRLVDVATGKITEIWRGQFDSYEVDPTGNWIAVHALTSAIYPEKELPGFAYGSIQLINLKSLERLQNPDPLPEPPGRFLRAKDGTIILLPNFARFDGGEISASPNMKYWAEIVDHNVKIYTRDWTLVREFSIPPQDTNLDNSQWNPQWPFDIQWSPDSSGLFLVYGRLKQSLYLVNISNGDVNLIEADLPWGYGAWFNVNQ